MKSMCTIEKGGKQEEREQVVQSVTALLANSIPEPLV